MQVEFPKWDGGFNLHFLSQWRKKIEVATSGCSAMGSNPYPNRKETHKMVCLFSGSFKLNVYFELVLVAYLMFLPKQVCLVEVGFRHLKLAIHQTKCLNLDYICFRHTTIPIC